MAMFIDFPEVDITMQGIEDVTIPSMVKIGESYDASKIGDPCAHLRMQMEKLPNHGSYAGKRICITAGSRGIPYFDHLLRTMCDVLKEWGARPFIIPAMGSHAGATAQGQLEMLAGYNVTEESMGVPILSSMEVVQYGELDGIPLYCDKNAMESDGIVIFNKVKPHTDFRGPHESGLAKMIAIGIAKHKGAAMFHSFGFHRFAELIPRVAEIFVQKCSVVFGVGLVQNAYDDICDLEVCTPDKLLETDARLLEVAKRRMAKFLFDHIDLLIIDEVGKNISGNGHDPNVTGRNITGTFGDVLDLKKLFIRGITPEAHHNGAGISAADVTTRAVMRDIDWQATWTNVLTTGLMRAGEMPLYMNNDEECIKLCLRTIYQLDYQQARIVHIKNTLDLNRIEVSVPLYESIKDVKGISLLGEPKPMAFDSEGNLAE